MNKLDLYKASAGSGKTHLLTESYLKLAFENPDNFHKILAVTFTNKAAEEMKSRIIEDLNAIIQKNESAQHFSGIQKYLNVKDAKIISERAIRLRDNILHNYTLFNVSTIDSFVQKVIRAFSYEINLNSSYDIEMDTNRVISDLTEILYNSIEDNKNLQDWLINYAEHKINQGENWDFRNEIKKLAEEIFKEKFQSLNQQQFNSEEKKKVLNDYFAILVSIKNRFESKMTNLSEKYQTIIEKFAVNPETLGNNFKFISGHFLKKIPAKEYNDISKTFLNAAEGVEKWYAKSAKPDSIETIKNIYPELIPLVNDFFEIIKTESEAYYTSEQIIKNFYSFGLLTDIADLLPDYRSDNNLLLISDTTLFLKKIIGNNEAPFIYEKIGNRFKHILIDEFQDTSGFQWDNFKPLIAESLSQGLYSLIVGDIKQSIYRWRGGDWKILLEGVERDIGSNLIHFDSLKDNWRSLENIIIFNNSVFHYLPQLIQNQFNNELAEIVNETAYEELCRAGYQNIIVNAYKDNEQNVPAKKKASGGKIQIKFNVKPKNEIEAEQQKRNIPELINNLLSEKKYLAGDIGILVRKNKEAVDLLNQLLDYQITVPEAVKYQIVSSDSLYVGNSSSVKILICTFKYLDNPADKINLAQLVYEYSYLTNSGDIDYSIVFQSVNENKYEKFLPKNFSNRLRKITKKSIYELTEELISFYALEDFADEFPYLRAFQDYVSEYMKHKNIGITDFIRSWDEKGRFESIQISDKINAVKVMTIHKAKGLAFKIVIIPNANWTVDHANVSPLIWAEMKEPPFNLLKFFPVKYNSRLKHTIFRKDYFDEKLFAYTDALNMLYVAFTRAKEELYVFSLISENTENNKNKINDIGNFIYELLKIKQVENEGFLNLNQFYNYSENIFISAENHKQNSENSEPIIKLTEIPEQTNYPVFNWQNKVKIKYNSEDFFVESIEKIEEQVNYGILMHQIFAEIKTVDDIENSLKKMHSEGYITQSETSELFHKISNVLQLDIVKDWFSDKYLVKNEEALITTKGNIKIPDRVLINDEELVVIDFKFGKPHEKYGIQLSEYKQLLQEVYQLPAKGYIFYFEKELIIEI